MIYFYLLSGLFLGWSLGANDAANIFGTAVTTKMLRFRTAALLAAIFVIVGAVSEGSGASRTLGQLGAINALPGAFTVALAAAVTVTFMTKFKLPVSTSQAIVGAIIGWNFFSGSETNLTSLTKIVTTWVVCPVLAAIFAMIIYKLFALFLGKSKIHILYIDSYTRVALIIVGIFGAYSLGANNIANVMGVFVTASPFRNIHFSSIFSLSGTQQLFLLGAIAIGVGIFTYSLRVMKTVGKNLFKLSPITALIVVLAESLVLFIFASRGLQQLIISIGLPPIPLVPVSSSQAVIGAVLGIAIAKGGKNIQFHVMGRISAGWVITPLISGILTFLALFVMKNVFDQQVYKPVHHTFTKAAYHSLIESGIEEDLIKEYKDMTFDNSLKLSSALRKTDKFTHKERVHILDRTRLLKCRISDRISQLNIDLLSEDQVAALKRYVGTVFLHRWQLEDALSRMSTSWQYKPDNLINRNYNEELRSKYDYLYNFFKVD